MQVIHRHFFNVSPINSNFQISSLAEFCFLSINSGFSQEIHLYSFETVSLRMDVCVPGLEKQSPTSKFSPWPCHRLFSVNKNKPSLTQLCMCERGCREFFFPVFYPFHPVPEIGCQGMSHWEAEHPAQESLNCHSLFPKQKYEEIQH